MRLIKSLALLTLSMSLLTGCGSNNQSEMTDVASPSESTTDTEITFMMPDWGVPTDEMLEDFKNETGITVTVLPTSWDDIRDKISTAAAGSQAAADVYEVDWSWVGEFDAAEWLLPLDVSEEDKADMPTIETFSVGDTALAVPYSNDFRIAFYNKEMFDQIGAPAPKTWDEVLESARELKSQGICEYPIAIPLKAEESTTTTLMWLAYSRNNEFFNEDGTVNRQSLEDALDIINTAVEDGLVDPANAEANGQVAYAKIISGETAFMIGPSFYVELINNPDESKVVGQVEAILLPGIDKEATATVPFAEGIGISKYTQHPEAAKKWVEWFTSKENQLRNYKELSLLPTRNSVLDKLIEDGDIKDAGAMVELSDMIESPFPNGVPKYYTKMSTEMFNTVNQMISGKLTVEEATNQIETNVNQIVEDNR